MRNPEAIHWDFSWVNDYLPGKVGLTNIDGVLHRDGETDRFLFIEQKHQNEPLGRGQERALRGFSRQPNTIVFVLYDLPDDTVKVARVLPHGLSQFRFYTKQEFGTKVGEWWASGAWRE